MDQLTIAEHANKMNLWMERINACRSSGKTVTAWCAENQIKPKTYYYWFRKMKQEAFQQLPDNCKALSVTSTEFAEITSECMPVSSGTAAVMHVNGVTLEVRNGADMNTIGQLVRMVRSIC